MFQHGETWRMTAWARLAAAICVCSAERAGDGAGRAGAAGASAFFSSTCLRFSFARFLSSAWNSSGGGSGLRRGLGAGVSGAAAATVFSGFSGGAGFGGTGFALGCGAGSGSGGGGAGFGDVAAPVGHAAPYR